MKEKLENILTMLVVVTIAGFFFIPVLLTIFELDELFNVWFACAVGLALFEAWVVLWYVPRHIIKGR